MKQYELVITAGVVGAVVTLGWRMAFQWLNIDMNSIVTSLVELLVALMAMIVIWSLNAAVAKRRR